MKIYLLIQSEKAFLFKNQFFDLELPNRTVLLELLKLVYFLKKKLSIFSLLLI